MNIEFNIPKLLWLDDKRDPFTQSWIEDFSPISKPYAVYWVKSYDEFVDWIELNGLPMVVFFDHDLADQVVEGQNEKTGYESAKWLVEYCLDSDMEPPIWRIQSDNPPGRDNINGIMMSYLKHYKNGKRG